MAEALSYHGQQSQRTVDRRSLAYDFSVPTCIGTISHM
jgi:hypothetical protein